MEAILRTLSGRVTAFGGDDKMVMVSFLVRAPDVHGLRVQGSGFRVQGSGFRVQGLLFMV